MKTILPALTLTLGAFVALFAAPGIASADDDEIKILTQNLYVGSNLFQILALYFNKLAGRPLPNLHHNA